MKRTRAAMVAAVALTIHVSAAKPSISAEDGIQHPVEAIGLPKRRAPRPPAAVEPPALPAGAETLAPLTLTVVTTWEPDNGKVRTARQTVLRTVDRVLVSVEGTANEWLFERNPVDPRRVSGYLIDHKERRVLVHDESDLRNGQGLRGWLDVLTLRFNPDTLKTLQPTADQEIVNGVPFVRYQENERAKRGGTEVWWSDRLMFPLRLTIREGQVLISSKVKLVAQQVANDKLVSPSTRFPSYRVSDVADARDYDRH
jgi:hypothetical protein